MIFVATSSDRKFRAYDQDNGKVIWEYSLPAGSDGVPAVYEIGGREYIVFCASAQVGLTPATQGKISGSYVAFALPAPH